MGGDLSKNIVISSEMHEYFSKLQEDIDDCYRIAEKARKKGFDPEFNVEIPQALDLAARVEQLVGPKEIAPKIREFTKRIGDRELVSLEISKEIVNGKKYKFNRTEEALDQAIRTGLAILTEGVLVAPLEGIAEVRIGKNKDGTDYVDLFFSGPIRSAGGTGQAMSVLIADVVRREMGIDKYKPTDGEVERYKEEIPLYKRVQHLQYTPSVDEIDRIVRGCPICVNGEGTEDEEVTGYRDLPRVGTNRLRGGACLVIAEGLCLKAPKIIKHVKKLKLKGWDFLDIFVNKDKIDEKKNNGIPEILPSTKYIGEVIAGRPVFSHPSRKGSFRLRYGRARTAGLASTAINPASMFLLDSFITVGTQLKTERPGKGTIGTPCTSIEGPIVLLQNGDLIQINDVKSIKNSDIKKIIDLGEILIPYGEFLENNSLLPESSYVYEWWIQDLQNKLNCLPKEYIFSEVINAEEKTSNKINEKFGRKINLITPSWEEAIQISTKYDVPLNPYYNLFWHDITTDDLVLLSNYIKENGIIENNSTLKIPNNDEIKRVLIELGALHKYREGSLVFDRYSLPLIRCCGLDVKDNKIIETDRIKNLNKKEDIISLVSKLSGIKVRPRAPFRIGTRMGRPEKAAARKMRPPPHVLFPIGNYGGNQRLIRNAADLDKIEVEAGTRLCPRCKKKTHRLFCTCGEHTKVGNGRIETIEINLAEELKLAQKNIKERTLPDNIKGVIGTISKNKTPEPLEKGILRAKHNVHVFKDGTTRFDMTDAPLTHFKPKEIGVTLNRLKELGYNKDHLGNALENDNQICELKVQDVIISKDCAEHFTQVSRFIDDLLVKLYGSKRFYNIKKLQDLTGHLTIGLAPHTSAGSLSRIIGFTDAQVCYAHPFYHAAKRRNCFDYNHRVFLYDSDKDKFITEKIGNIVENFIKKNSSKKIDLYGTERVDIKFSNNLFAYCLNINTGKLQKKKVKYFIKGKTNKWIKIKTSTNREIKVTPDHDILVINAGGLTIKKAKEIQEGDRIPIALKIPKETIISKINIPKALSELNDDVLLNIKLRNSKIFFKNLVKNIGRKKVIKFCSIKGSYVNNLGKWYSSVPLLHFKKICENTNINFNDLPEETFVGIRRDYINIPVYIKDINSLFWILGIYCAEGWSRSNRTSHQISFRSEDSEILEKLKKEMKKLFTLKPYEQGSKFTYSSKILYLLFSEIWKAGSTAYEKKIPEIIYHGSEQSIKKFLSAFFDGDGSISLNPDRVAFYSVSQKLVEGIANLLLRENIFVRYHKTKMRLPGRKILERYKKLGREPARHQLFHLILTGEDKYRFARYVEPISNKKKMRSSKMFELKPPTSARLINYNGLNYEAVSFSDYTFDIVKELNSIDVKNDSTYCLDVFGNDIQDKAVLWHNQLLQIRCDGDEDGLMLLLDALLNFSHSYIPDKRGGRMDLPLILTTRIDPSEVDKEAHNVDTLAKYPLKFYESTLRHEHSKELESIMGLVSSRIGSELQYEKFGFTHDTEDISEGPKKSNYKTLKTMMDKMNAQLNLAAKIRAVDEADVAYKVIERHFLPDIIGNMRAFSKQSVRCPTCNIVYRRPPLIGLCQKCKGKLTLTVHEKSVKKYLEISKEIAQRYNISPYARQRIKLVEKSIDSLFMSDKIKTTKLTDFL